MNKEGPNSGRELKFGHLEEGRYNVKDSWLEAYIVANISVPQAFFGIDPLLTEAIFQDLPDNWVNFSQSQLSAIQLQRLSEVLTRAHAGLGINHAVRGQSHHMPEGMQVNFIPTSRVLNLWPQARDRVVKNLSDIFCDTYGHSGYSNFDMSNLDLFFKNPQNIGKIDEFKKILSLLKKAFQDSEVQDLLRSYRKSLLDYSIKNPNTFLRGPFQSNENDIKFAIKEKLKSLGLDVLGSFARLVLSVLEFDPVE